MQYTIYQKLITAICFHDATTFLLLHMHLSVYVFLAVGLHWWFVVMDQLLLEMVVGRYISEKPTSAKFNLAAIVIFGDPFGSVDGPLHFCPCL